ncbi:hypothetical protein ACLHDG_01780 [Sulfurovum sp. CS9]|uniref:hypothetical protein n=1 Tax=Sulfurovum sp. CS9 TaxID=3391146 RepID=UPI0039ED4BDC
MVDPITLGIGMGAFLFGYIAHSNNSNKACMQGIETMIEQNKEFVSLSSTIEILNRDIDTKNSLIAELEGEADHQQENINRLLQRAEYLRNSGELEKLEELAQTTKNLTHLKQTLSKVQVKQVERFNIGILISLVQNMYAYIHKEELDILGVQDLMTDFSDSGSDDKGDAFGGMSKKPSTPKLTGPTGPGV